MAEILLQTLTKKQKDGFPPRLEKKSFNFLEARVKKIQIALSDTHSQLHACFAYFMNFGKQKIMLVFVTKTYWLSGN
jgi:hypothetical protein